MTDVDVLMITHRRSDYVGRSLPRLLDQCDGVARVWLWHNGEDRATLDIVRAHAGHDAVAELRHSPENAGQRDPINWLLSTAPGAYVSKVDDDCLVGDGWIESLRSAHRRAPELGVVGTWRFFPEDYLPEIAGPKIATVGDDVTLLRNHWVQGSGFLMKRSCVEQAGRLGAGELLPGYFIRLGLAGWVNGWLQPFIREDHMDDPRSPNTALKTDEDLLARMPLTAKRNRVKTLDEWVSQLQRTARVVQEAPLEPRHYRGWRRQRQRLLRKVRSLRGMSEW